MSLAEYAYNNRQHSSTKQSPFLINYGYQVTSPTTTGISKVHEANKSVEQLQELRQTVHDALEKSSQMMKKYADRKRRPSPEYKEGDKVWLDSSNIQTTRPTKKLEDK